MRKTQPQTVALACHPSSPSSAVRGLTASARIGGAGKLAVRFVLDAEMAQVVLPPLRPSVRTDELWRHTCFEVFVGLPDSEAYCELNFSPSTEWAMYGFVAYRRGMTPLEVRRPPRVAVRPMGRGLTKITSYGELGMAISPSWSFDGGKIAFTLIGSRSHYLGIWSGGGKPAVHTMPCTSVVSPHFLPNGQIAVALNLRSESAICHFSPARRMVSSSCSMSQGFMT